MSIQIHLQHARRGRESLYPLSRLEEMRLGKHFIGAISTVLNSRASQDDTAKNATAEKSRSKRLNAIFKSFEQSRYNWAKDKKVILICGHTHRAVFCSISKIDQLTKEIEQIVAKASAGGPVQTIRIEQAPLKITTDDKPYQL